MTDNDTQDWKLTDWTLADGCWWSELRNVLVPTMYYQLFTVSRLLQIQLFLSYTPSCPARPAAVRESVREN